MDHITTQPYLADRATLLIWAQGAGCPGTTIEDTECVQRWLDDHPAALAFGIDDDDIQVAFGDVHIAGEWLKELIAAPQEA